MEKLLNEEKDLLYLYDRTILILEFMISKSTDPILNEVKHIFITAFDKKNLKALKSMSRDINEWSRGLKENDVNELNLLLKKFDGSLSVDHLTKKLLNGIIEKNKIENAEEFRIVHELLNNVDISDSIVYNRNDLENLLKKYIDNKG